MSVIQVLKKLDVSMLKSHTLLYNEDPTIDIQLKARGITYIFDAFSQKLVEIRLTDMSCLEITYLDNELRFSI